VVDKVDGKHQVNVTPRTDFLNLFSRNSHVINIFKSSPSTSSVGPAGCRQRSLFWHIEDRSHYMVRLTPGVFDEANQV